jgi:hypothetical protein
MSLAFTYGSEAGTVPFAPDADDYIEAFRIKSAIYTACQSFNLFPSPQPPLTQVSLTFDGRVVDGKEIFFNSDLDGMHFALVDRRPPAAKPAPPTPKSTPGPKSAPASSSQSRTIVVNATKEQ